MSKNKEYAIDLEETFEYRRPVLDDMLPGRWQLTEDGKRIKFDIPFPLFSRHEKDIIEFARNPYALAKNVFSGLDKPRAQLLAEAIHRLFGPNGALYIK